VSKRFSGETLAVREREPAPPDLLQRPSITGWIDEHGQACMVLRGGTNHRRTADIDLLDAVVQTGARGHRFVERVEVAHQQLERRHSELVELPEVLRLTRVGKQAGMDPRVQCLYPSVQAFWE
jgi:hypothetical protein